MSGYKQFVMYATAPVGMPDFSDLMFHAHYRAITATTSDVSSYLVVFRNYSFICPPLDWYWSHFQADSSSSDQMNITLIFALPVMNAPSCYFDKDESGGIDSVRPPSFEIFGPVLFELRVIAKEFGDTFHMDEERTHAEKARLALIAEADIGIVSNISDHPCASVSKEPRITVEFDLSIVAHRTA